jgi:hypothetical protein
MPDIDMEAPKLLRSQTDNVDPMQPLDCTDSRERTVVLSTRPTQIPPESLAIPFTAS